MTEPNIDLLSLEAVVKQEPQAQQPTGKANGHQDGDDNRAVGVPGAAAAALPQGDVLDLDSNDTPSLLTPPPTATRNTMQPSVLDVFAVPPPPASESAAGIVPEASLVGEMESPLATFNSIPKDTLLPAAPSPSNLLLLDEPYLIPRSKESNHDDNPATTKTEATIILTASSNTVNQPTINVETQNEYDQQEISQTENTLKVEVVAQDHSIPPIADIPMSSASSTTQGDIHQESSINGTASNLAVTTKLNDGDSPIMANKETKKDEANGQMANDNDDDRENWTVQQLRKKLQQTQIEMEEIRNEQARRMEDDGALLLELQSKLQQHMSARAEAENKVRVTEQAMEELKKRGQQTLEELEQFREMEKSWASQKTDQAEVENDFRLAKSKMSKLEEEKAALQEIIANLQQETDQLKASRSEQEEELKTLRDQRDEQERREIALTNRLNAAKKKEADKANLAEHFEDEMKAVRDDAQKAKAMVDELIQAKTVLEHQLAQIQASSQAKIRQAELALADEKRLNDDRKAKMKAFIEKKSEELRQAKDDADSMRSELNQTSRSLVDLNNRWKQLHAQWVQSQTRNRELQRDLNRIKKDSENLHKVGDTLEMKLSRSATETEQHKNKRLAAKNELMTVLKTLEAEREVSARLRDAIKFTFTPKALSQQQLLRENLEEFDNELLRLSRQLGKPVPASAGGGLDGSSRSLPNSDLGEEDGKATRADLDIQRLIGKLDHETQGVSQYIIALTTAIEKLHVLIDASASRNCYSTLSGLLLGGGHPQSGDGNAAESSVPLRAIRSHQYGQVPSNGTS